MDRAAKAALLIEAQVLSRFPWGVLPHRQSLKDPLQAAARRTGGCRRISRHLSQFLAVDLHPVEPDGPRREQVGIRQDHAPALSYPGRAVPSRHGTAAFLLSAGQPGPWQAPAQRQGTGGSRCQDHGPVPQEVNSVSTSQRGQAREYQRGHKNHRQEHRLKTGGIIIPHGGGVKAPQVSPLLAGTPWSFRDQVRGVIVQRCQTEAIIAAPAFPADAPLGKAQRQSRRSGIGKRFSPPRNKQPQRAVHHRRQHRQRHQQCADAAFFTQLPDRVHRHVPAQHQFDQQTGQHGNALDLPVSGPEGDRDAGLLRRHSGDRHQRCKKGKPQRPVTALIGFPLLRRDLAKLRFFPDALCLGKRLYRFLRGFHGIVELLRFLLPLPGEQPPFRLQQRFVVLLHHGPYRCPYQFFQTQEAGSLRLRAVICPWFFLRVRIVGKGGLPVLFQRRRSDPFLPEGHRRFGRWRWGRLCRFRGGRLFRSRCLGRIRLCRSGLTLHLFHDFLLAAGAVLRQNFL